MSARNAAQLHIAISEALKIALLQLRSRQPFDPNSWNTLQALTNDTNKLSSDISVYTVQVLVRLTCAHAANACMHNEGEEKMLEVTKLLERFREEHNHSIDGHTQLALHTYRALLGRATYNAFASGISADAMERWVETAPNPLVQACIWLMCGELGLWQKRRKALRRALKQLRQLDQTFQVRLLTYRVHMALTVLHYRNHHRSPLGWWHTRRAEALVTELQLCQGLGPDWRPTHDQLMPPLVELLGCS